MNQGLGILIARTKTHPEEFIGTNISLLQSKWLTMIDDFEYYMTEEEKKAWEEAKEDLNEYKRTKRRDDFTQAVMKELLIREDGDGDGVALNNMPHPQPNVGALRFNYAKDQYEVYTGNQVWQIIPMPVVAGGSGGGGVVGSGGGGSGSVTIKTPTGTHTFTKSGTFTG
jgi:hypothetical protein